MLDRRSAKVLAVEVAGSGGESHYTIKKKIIAKEEYLQECRAADNQEECLADHVMADI